VIQPARRNRITLDPFIPREMSHVDPDVDVDVVVVVVVVVDGDGDGDGDVNLAASR
jgi:hypothetical protein